MKKCWILRALFAVVALTVAETSHPPQAKASNNLVTSANGVLQTKLLDPLQEKEDKRSRFSRAAFPPSSRRIRILDTSAQIDAKGHPFVLYAIDESRGFGSEKDIAEADWFKDTITGCVYPETGDVLVKRGEVFYPAPMLWGAPTPIAAVEVCKARS